MNTIIIRELQYNSPEWRYGYVAVDFYSLGVLISTQYYDTGNLSGYHSLLWDTKQWSKREPIYPLGR